MSLSSQYMLRCIELAQKGAGYVAPNPMVGSVIVHDEKIIGEGWHRQYGKEHAEVNAINDAISKGFENVLTASTLYVTLEPCSHYGKTPPCADLIIHHKIPRVVIGCQDPFKEVSGRGIQKLKDAGVEVETGVMETKCRELNKRFFTYQLEQRPYIILKWAQTTNRIMGNGSTGPRLMISNEYTNALVHRWRSQEAAILVGTTTAHLDDPSLTTREWSGPSPQRLVLDMDLKLPASLRIFDKTQKTIIFNAMKHEEHDHIYHCQLSRTGSVVPQIAHALFGLKIQSVLVEGGNRLLQSFINEGYWDEAKVITGQVQGDMNGIPAPQLKEAVLVSEDDVKGDRIRCYVPSKSK